MIQARLRKTFPARPDSAGFSLDLEFQAAAGITVLFGPSGSGKTLVLDSIAGFVRPDEGRILLDDDILFDGATGVHLTPQARQCGYVFQNYALFPHMTLRQNLEFAAERRPRLERHRRVNEMLERFRLADAAGSRPHEVSGGQRQRVGVARALAADPPLLLFDEPFGALDPVTRVELQRQFLDLRRGLRKTSIFVTHDVREALRLGTRIGLLTRGRLEVAADPQTFRNARTEEALAFLGSLD